MSYISSVLQASYMKIHALLISLQKLKKVEFIFQKADDWQVTTCKLYISGTSAIENLS